MDPHSTEQWETILGGLPAPEGQSMEVIMANSVLGNLLGYLHPTGSEATRKRRQRDKDRDARELANAMIAFGRLFFDRGVRP